MKNLLGIRASVGATLIRSGLFPWLWAVPRDVGFCTSDYECSLTGPHARTRLAPPPMGLCGCFLREASTNRPAPRHGPSSATEGSFRREDVLALLGRPFKKYATTEGDPIDRCTRSSLRTTYFGALVELGRNPVHDRMNCAEEVPSLCGLLLHLMQEQPGDPRTYLI